MLAFTRARHLTSVKGRKGFTGYIYGTRAGFSLAFCAGRRCSSLHSSVLCTCPRVNGFTVGVLQSAHPRAITSVKGRKGFTGYIYSTRAGFSRAFCAGKRCSSLVSSLVCTCTVMSVRGFTVGVLQSAGVHTCTFAPYSNCKGV